MSSRLIITLVAAAMLTASAAGGATAAPPRFPTFIGFDAAMGEFTEGVAVDKSGNVFVSFDAPPGEVRRFTPAGEESVLVDFGAPGVLG